MAFLQCAHEVPPKHDVIGLLNGIIGILGILPEDRDAVWFSVFKNKELHTFEWNECVNIGNEFCDGDVGWLPSFLFLFLHFALRFWNHT